VCFRDVNNILIADIGLRICLLQRRFVFSTSIKVTGTHLLDRCQQVIFSTSEPWHRHCTLSPEVAIRQPTPFNPLPHIILETEKKAGRATTLIRGFLPAQVQGHVGAANIKK
jgi:hypothetical protein